MLAKAVAQLTEQLADYNSIKGVLEAAEHRGRVQTVSAENAQLLADKVLSSRRWHYLGHRRLRNGVSIWWRRCPRQ